MQEGVTEKGRSVIADKCCKQGDFLCCYKGELINKAEGERRKCDYREELGSYLFFFNHNGKDLWFVEYIMHASHVDMHSTNIVLMLLKRMEAWAD